MSRAAGSLARCLAIAALVLARVPAWAQARLEVGPNTQVSALRAADTHYEVHAAADPSRPGRIVVGSIVYPATNELTNTVVYASSDGGRTWRATLDGPALESTGDPAVAFGDGSAYYTASSLPPGGGERTMRFFRSRDGGRTWSDTSTLTYTDRQYVTVDATGGRWHGRVYVHGNNRIPRGISDVVVFASTDGGRTFNGPGTREGFGRYTAQSMGSAVVRSDGTLVIVFSESRDGGQVLNATTSVDGGQTLTPAVTIGAFVAGGSRKGDDNNVNSQPILAIDATRGPFRDRLYVAWPDRRSGRSQILLSASSDGGRTWSPARIVNDNAPADTTDQFMPTVAVNRDGVLGVTWYDRRGHPDNMGWDVRFTASLDGGESFAPSVQVSSAGTTFGARIPWTGLRSATSRAPGGTTLRVSLNTFTFLGGDTAGLAADADGTFHAVWVDNRTGVPQVWTAPVRVRPHGGPPHREAQRAVTNPARVVTPQRDGPVNVPLSPPDESLGGELSERLALVVTRTSYDREEEKLSVVAHLENRSPQSVRGPFRMRVAALRGELGDPVPLEPDNGQRGVGAEWVFEAAELPPRGRSASRTLHFTLTNPRPYRSGRVYRLGVLELIAGIFAR